MIRATGGRQFAIVNAKVCQDLSAIPPECELAYLALVVASQTTPKLTPLEALAKLTGLGAHAAQTVEALSDLGLLEISEDSVTLQPASRLALTLPLNDNHSHLGTPSSWPSEARVLNEGEESSPDSSQDSSPTRYNLSVRTLSVRTLCTDPDSVRTDPESGVLSPFSGVPDSGVQDSVRTDPEGLSQACESPLQSESRSKSSGSPILRISDPPDSELDSGLQHCISEREGKEDEGGEGKRARDLWFDAVADVCVLDPKVSGSYIAKTSWKLRKAGYAPEDIRRWYGPGGWWYSVRTLGIKNPPPPSPPKLLTTINIAKQWDGQQKPKKGRQAPIEILG